jgi:hypothetical protein
MSDVIWIASFDIGKKNFAFCIEEIDLEKFSGLCTPARRYNGDGTPTQGMEKVLKSVYSNGRIILHKNLDLTGGCDPKAKLDPKTFVNMVEALEMYVKYWDMCDVFIIEEQMSFGKKMNRMAMKLGQHCYSYFVFKYRGSKCIVEFPAYHKTVCLGAEKVEGKPYKNGNVRYKTMEKPQRKKWSVEKAMEILEGRGELEVLEGLTSFKKRDDLADVLTQLQAYKVLTYVKN